jgi:hypothetical protein
MKQSKKKYSAIETTGGTYSARKVPQWRIGNNELLEYLAALDKDWDDLIGDFSPA